MNSHPNKTRRSRRPSRLLRQERRRWDDEFQNPLALGCPGCPEFALCGGLHKRQQGMSCMDDCCNNPSNCEAVCPRNPRQFILRQREVNSFDLSNVPRAKPLTAARMPVYVPRLYHGSRRAQLLESDTVAIPLHALYRRRDGMLTFASRKEIAAKYKISPHSKFILVGCGYDQSIEAWWRLSSRRREIIAFLKKEGFELATAPNYSLFTNQLRFDDMHSMKRIAKVWQEFLEAGLPCALHVNARTTRDYERWAEFIRTRPEVTHIVFEFGTVWRYATRQQFHLQHLAWLAHAVGRPLHFVMIGGMTALSELATAYESVTYVDGTPFLKTIKRQRVVEGNDGQLSFKPQPTEQNSLLDELFADNLRSMRRRVEKIVSEAYARRAVARTEQTPKIPDMRASEPIARPSVPDEVQISSERDPLIEIADRR